MFEKRGAHLTKIVERIANNFVGFLALSSLRSAIFGLVGDRKVMHSATARYESWKPNLSKLSISPWRRRSFRFLRLRPLKDNTIWKKASATSCPAATYESQSLWGQMRGTAPMGAYNRLFFHPSSHVTTDQQRKMRVSLLENDKV